MSKLIVCTGTLSAGGAERVLSILSKPFADAFDEVHYVMWLDYQYPDVFYDIDSRVKIVKISKESGSKSSLKHCLWFRKYIKKEKADVVLSFMVMINFAVLLSLLGCKNRIIVSERNDPRVFSRGKFVRSIIFWLYARSNVRSIVMQTENNRIYLPKRLQQKSIVIYNPVSISDDIKRLALRKPKDDLIVSVGRLEKQKSQDVLIQAFAKFHETHPNYRLIIYGEGSQRNKLVELVEKLELTGSVSLPGRVGNVPKTISSARMFVLTSEFEGMSNALLEAMAVGLPCISTKVSGSTELIKDNENGLLVDVGDINGIAKAMSFIASNPDLGNKYGELSSEITEQLNEVNISHKWIKLINELLCKQ